MAKSATIKVKLVSSADTGFYYVTKKNSRTMTEKLTMKKYDPVAQEARRIPRSQNQVSPFSVATYRGRPRGRPLHLRGSDCQRLKRRWPAGSGVIEEATHTAPRPAEPHGSQEMRRT